MRRGTKLNLFPNRMAGNNHESQTRPHPISRTVVNPKIPMSYFKEWLEALCPRTRNGPRSQVDETNQPTGIELTNLLLLELLQKHGELLQRQNKHL